MDFDDKLIPKSLDKIDCPIEANGQKQTNGNIKLRTFIRRKRRRRSRKDVTKKSTLAKKKESLQNPRI